MRLGMYHRCCHHIHLSLHLSTALDFVRTKEVLIHQPIHLHLYQRILLYHLLRHFQPQIGNHLVHQVCRHCRHHHLHRRDNHQNHCLFVMTEPNLSCLWDRYQANQEPYHRHHLYLHPHPDSHRHLSLFHLLRPSLFVQDYILRIRSRPPRDRCRHLDLHSHLDNHHHQHR